MAFASLHPGNCSGGLFPTPLYLLHPWSRHALLYLPTSLWVARAARVPLFLDAPYD